MSLPAELTARISEAHEDLSHIVAALTQHMRTFGDLRHAVGRYTAGLDAADRALVELTSGLTDYIEDVEYVAAAAQAIVHERIIIVGDGDHDEIARYLEELDDLDDPDDLDDE